MKNAKQYLEEANQAVIRIPAGEALSRHGDGKALFIDVRDSGDIAKSGTIAGALRIPRGFMEFAADEATPFHHAAVQKDAELFLVCGAGGQAALAGIGEWKDAGGAMED